MNMQQDLFASAKEYDEKEGKKNNIYWIMFVALLFFYLFLRLFNTKFEFEEGVLSLKYSTEWNIEVPAEYEGQKVMQFEGFETFQALHVVTLEFEEGIMDIDGVEKSSTLRKVVFPSTVERIEDNAFSLNENLKEIIFPEIVEGTLWIGREAFKLSKVEELVLPDGTVVINGFAFANCKKLESLQIPDTVECIGCASFCNNERLNNINFPKKMQGELIIGSSAFAKCSIEELILPKGTRVIGDSAFYHCRQCAYIEIPSSVECIGCNAFEASGVEKIVFPEKMDGDLTIQNDAFACTPIEEMIFPDETVAIEGSIFRDCNKLKRVIFPEQLKKINLDKMFYNCDALEYVKFPKKMSTFVDGEETFYCCTMLSEIEFPEDMRALDVFCSLEETQISVEQIPDKVYFAKTASGIYYDYDKENEYLSGESGIPISVIEEAMNSDQIWIEGKWYDFPMDYNNFLGKDEWEVVGEEYVEKGGDYEVSKVLRHKESGRYLNLLINGDDRLIVGYQVLDNCYTEVDMKEEGCQVVAPGGIICGLSTECRSGMLAGTYEDEHISDVSVCSVFTIKDGEQWIRVYYSSDAIIERYVYER